MGDFPMANNTSRPGIEVIIEDVDDSPTSHTKSRKKNSVMHKAPVLWQKITTVLQDNRLIEHEPSSPALNTIRPNDQRLLKKLLNITFLTIGICLLIAIIVVIIYTSVVPDPKKITPAVNQSNSTISVNVTTTTPGSV